MKGNVVRLFANNPNVYAKSKIMIERTHELLNLAGTWMCQFPIHD